MVLASCRATCALLVLTLGLVSHLLTKLDGTIVLSVGHASRRDSFHSTLHVRVAHVNCDLLIALATIQFGLVVEQLTVNHG